MQRTKSARLLSHGLCTYALKMHSFDQIEDRLLQLGRLIESQSSETFEHPAQKLTPEWDGADVAVTSDFSVEHTDGMAKHVLEVRTIHARQLSWLFFSLRDVFSEYLNFQTKYDFFERLARSAREFLARNAPEPPDAKPLLAQVLRTACNILKDARNDKGLPCSSAIVEHSEDSEGNKTRRSE